MGVEPDGDDSNEEEWDWLRDDADDHREDWSKVAVDDDEDVSNDRLAGHEGATPRQIDDVTIQHGFCEKCRVSRDGRDEPMEEHRLITSVS